VESYIAGQASTIELGAKHNISPSVVKKWIQKYYNGIEQKNYVPNGEAYTMKSRKTVFQERLEIVQWVIENDMNYRGAADKYGIRYSLVYSWVRKYNENGAEALKNHKRGPKRKTSADKSGMSQTEQLKHELEREKSLRKKAEFKLEVFKKKEEMEKKLLSQK
jgi:transposase-like protein